MAWQTEFVASWKERFPGSDVPHNVLKCIAERDRDGMHQAHETCRIRMKQLQKELQHQEFIYSFLHNKLADKRVVESTISPDSDSLDVEVPLISSTDTLASDHAYSEVYDNVDNSSPVDSKPKSPVLYVNESSFASGTSTNSESTFTERKQVLSQVPSKPVPAPRTSMRNSYNPDRSTVYIMQHNVPTIEAETDQRKVARVGSLDSYSKPKQPPKLPAKPTKKFMRSLHTYESIEIDDGKPNVSASEDQVGPLLTKTPSEESSVEIAISPKHDTNPSPVYDGTTAPLSTFKPKTSPQTSRFSPVLSRTSAVARDNSLSQKNSQSGDSNHIYDEPIPVKKDQCDDDASSSDEEPVYYNLYLLKQKQAMIDSRMTLASFDHHKKRLENEAKKLSCRFSVQQERIPKEVQPVKPPLMKPINKPMKKIKGVTEEESNTEHGSGGESAHEDRDLDSLGGRSGSVDSITSGGSAVDDNSWQKRPSMFMTSGDDSYSDDLELDVAACPESEKLQMRKWVVNSIIDSEQQYVSTLGVLQQYRNSFQAAEKTFMSVISEDDIGVIFFGIPDLHRIHQNFIQSLKPRVESWTMETQVADAFKELAVEELPIAKMYLNNYHKAVACIHKCSQDQRFHDMTQEIKVTGVKQAPTLEELLHKPVVRFQRNTLVLHDLINCTPVSHPDYDQLQKTLKLAQNFLDNFQAPQGEKEHGENSRYLARCSVIVEQIGSHRKLRHIFLFNDIFVCSKQKITGRSKIHHEPKWCIPLLDLTLDDKVTDDERMLVSHRENIESLQKKVSELQKELKSEMTKLKKANEGQRTWSMRSHNKTIERLRKKLMDQEATLMLQSPHLQFRLKNGKNNKSFTLLLSSDYERTNWKETIACLKGKVTGTVNISSIDLPHIINTVKLPKITSGSLMDESVLLEDEHLFGMLNVTIHKLTGLKTNMDTYCYLELDSFGHFFMKAKTRINRGKKDPTWNEAFELDLEGANTLRILCYSASPGSADRLLGKCALELSKAWLRGDFQEKSIPLSQEMTISVSMRYASREQTMLRRPSAVKGGVFGQDLKKVVTHEGREIPLVVTACVQEVEARGLDELGIYRVSGLSSDIQELKKAFDKSSRAAVQMAHDVDINVLSSLLKLYLRELPEGLLTDKSYSGFTKGMTLSDPEAKEKYMIQLVNALPAPHKATLLYLLDHMLKVNTYAAQNKMTLNNLATVFGPTLLRKTVKKSEATATIEMFTENAKEAMIQTGVLLYLLQLRQGGWDHASTKL